MPLLPMESPAGVIFDYASGASGIHLHAANGIYLVDTVNGTVYLSALARSADLASTDPGEGAALVGIEDAGGFYSVGTVEGALQKLGTAQVITVDVTIPGGTGAGNAGSLNSNPVEVIAAPAAGLCVVVEEVRAWLDFAAAAYDGAAAGEDLVLGYAGGDDVTNPVDHSGFADAAADAHRIVTGASGYAPLAATAVEARVLVGDWYTAAGDSPVKLRIRYRLESLEW